MQLFDRPGALFPLTNRYSFIQHCCVSIKLIVTIKAVTELALSATFSKTQGKMSTDPDRSQKVEAKARLRALLRLLDSTEPASCDSHKTAPAVSVLHRVLAFEDKSQAPEIDILPLPEALSHSLSGCWKQLVLETGKPVWHRSEREPLSSEVSNCAKEACR